MTPVPIHRLKKEEIVWLSTHRCKHKHTYLEHYNCYIQDNPSTERVGFYDIETTNLDANFGIILTYYIKTAGEDQYSIGVIKKRDIMNAKAGDEDKVVVQNLVRDLSKFDTLVGYYSSRFDMPFIRTRATMLGIPFLAYGAIKHIDLYDTIKHKMKLNSNRLENACRNLMGHTDKTHIEAKYWRAGARGDKESLEYIATHNKHDVDDLEKLYELVVNFRRPVKTSI